MSETTKPTYYVSGPMSGLPEFNFPAFRAACADLRGLGYSIVSPHEKDSEGDTNRPWEEYLREDIALMMAQCHGLILLPGWTGSTGAKLELSIALALKWPVHFYSPAKDGIDSELVCMRTGEAA